MRIQTEDFNVSDLQQRLTAGRTASGAVATFVGLVRSTQSAEIQKMLLEHYPGMTERSIQAIIDRAKKRWSLLGVQVVHRVGSLLPGEQIVYVGICSMHRSDAFAACEFVMDYLKTRAPFWKKEYTASGEHWVEVRSSDEVAAARWD
ncbi:MAG: molybdopterin synthase catalytic subunit MoaE [Pseudomonadota bacterium]